MRSTIGECVTDLRRLTNEELYREYYHPTDPARSPAEANALREEIRRRVDAIGAKQLRSKS